MGQVISGVLGVTTHRSVGGPEPSGGTGHGTLLFVVGQREDARSMTTAMEDAGWWVAIANGAHDAEERLERWRPDVAVVDIAVGWTAHDPPGPGLRHALAARHVPVIVMSHSPSANEAAEAFALGADDYVPASIDPVELLARAAAKMARPPVARELLLRDLASGLLSQRAFTAEIEREAARVGAAVEIACLACVRLDEHEVVRLRFGHASIGRLVAEVGADFLGELAAFDLVGRGDHGELWILMPESDTSLAKERLATISRAIAGHTFTLGEEHLGVTPVVGVASFDSSATPQELRRRANVAVDAASAHLDLQPVVWSPDIEPAVVEAPPPASFAVRVRRGLRTLARRLRTPWQIFVTAVISLVLPFTTYWVLAERGFDVTPIMYTVVVMTLLVTAFLIWTEGFLALRRVEPPPAPDGPRPAASAIIAAYLPNEAATVIETVQSFLASDYPGPLQVILAYNTPRDLPVETQLHDIAFRDPRFLPLRVEGSTSKAQNVNAALRYAQGVFTGIFDADHHTAPGSFDRAWRWIASGADVVQGRAVVRNGGASMISRLVAVEFEGIYGVSHPGRARMHGWGIFGGSNGYWRTTLLRETRMHGFMLTEDIDSSLRVVEQGGRIVSDPGLVSRELATTTLRQLWNQRMRWAQGWYQVSLKHIWRGVRSRELTGRQKLGFVHLLGWREVYPWLSAQILPIIVFWIVRGGTGSVSWFVPVFVLTTLFTMATGPGQTLFAYRLATPEVKKHTAWFLLYLVVASVLYTEFKNMIVRVAQVKEAMGERDWRVTPRSVTPPS